MQTVLPEPGSENAGYVVKLDPTHPLDNPTTQVEVTRTEEVTTVSEADLSSPAETGDYSLTFDMGNYEVVVSTSTRDSAGNDMKIYSGQDGVGVEDTSGNGRGNGLVNPHEQLDLTFQNDSGDPVSLDNPTISLTNFSGDLMEGAGGPGVDIFKPDFLSWEAYDADGNLVTNGFLEGTQENAANGDTATLTITGENISQIQISTETKGTEFSVEKVSGTTTEEVTVTETVEQELPEQAVDYTVQVTDDDVTNGQPSGDMDTSDVFTVTFDSDGSITGTDAAEVISGSSQADTIDGGGGNDIIFGLTGDGSDTTATSEAAEVVDADPAVDVSVSDTEMDQLIDNAGQQ